MEAEMTEHLGYEPHDPAGNNTGNSRNGKNRKTLKGDFGEMTIETPRDRTGSFEPKIVKKGQRRFEGFDDKIIALYSRGMSTRDIQDQLKEMYDVEISPELVSRVTESVLEDVRQWQNRPLDAVYPVTYLDAIFVKIRDSGQILNKACYLAIGIDITGHKDVLGIWLGKTEGAKFWLSIVSELRSRGVQDILIACVDGLKGFPEAIESVFPQSEIQICMVHMVRNSMKFVSWKDRKEIAAGLKDVYQAPTEEAGRMALDTFAAKWDGKYPMVSRSWYENWPRVIPLFSCPQEIRRLIYTTNAIESLNNTLKKTLKTKYCFPTDEAAIKQVYLSVLRAIRKWGLPVRDWNKAINQFMIKFNDRLLLN
jgi:putative transposase